MSAGVRLRASVAKGSNCILRWGEKSEMME